MKRIFVLLLLTTVSVHSWAQRPQSQLSFADRIFFGGNIALQIGTYTDIEISPIVGYYITPRWSAGVGATYRYINLKYWYMRADGSWQNFETNIWGGRLFTNYVLINNVNEWIPLGMNFRIFAHCEYEFLRFEGTFFNNDGADYVWQQSVLGGGGLRFPMGRRSSMNMSLLWYLYTKPRNTHDSGPIIRLGFNF